MVYIVSVDCKYLLQVSTASVYCVFAPKYSKTMRYIEFSLQNVEKALVLFSFRPQTNQNVKKMVLWCVRSEFLKKYWFHYVFAQNC